MKQNILALISGIIFGLGLCHSEMVNPAVVIGFLDVTGDWNPALAGVMAGALLVTAVFYRFIRPGGLTVCRTPYYLPEKTAVDAPLIAGSVLFGVGWGISGVCPGPAVTALSFFEPKIVAFFVSMMVAMAGYSLLTSSRRQKS